MATTYLKIATVTVGSGGASTIDFTSIPQTYDDLSVFLSGRTNGSGGTGFDISFNSTTTGYTNRAIQGNGASVSSYSNYQRNAGMISYSADTASTFGSTSIYIPNYRLTQNKSYSADGIHETNSSTAYAVMVAGLWSNTSAITSISLAPMSGSFVQYSSATLYGINKS